MDVSRCFWADLHPVHWQYTDSAVFILHYTVGVKVEISEWISASSATIHLNFTSFTHLKGVTCKLYIFSSSDNSNILWWLIHEWGCLTCVTVKPQPSLKLLCGTDRVESGWGASSSSWKLDKKTKLLMKWLHLRLLTLLVHQFSPLTVWRHCWPLTFCTYYYSFDSYHNYYYVLLLCVIFCAHSELPDRLMSLTLLQKRFFRPVVGFRPSLSTPLVLQCICSYRSHHSPTPPLLLTSPSRHCWNE